MASPAPIARRDVRRRANLCERALTRDLARRSRALIAQSNRPAYASVDRVNASTPAPTTITTIPVTTPTSIRARYRPPRPVSLRLRAQVEARGHRVDDRDRRQPHPLASFVKRVVWLEKPGTNCVANPSVSVSLRVPRRGLSSCRKPSRARLADSQGRGMRRSWRRLSPRGKPPGSRRSVCHPCAILSFSTDFRGTSWHSPPCAQNSRVPANRYIRGRQPSRRRDSNPGPHHYEVF
jgi:hypothetical protein